MKKLLVGLAVLALWSAAGVAQQPAGTGKVSLLSRGDSARAAFDSLAQGLGFAVKYDESLDVEEDLKFSVWLRLKDSEPERAARLLSTAAGKAVRLDTRRKLVLVGDNVEAPPRATIVRGYDVSVATSRFVAYQEALGTPRRATSAKATEDATPPAPPAERTASQHLADTLNRLLSDDDGNAPDFAVAGDRLVLRDTEATHSRVRECLNLLINDTGGQSSESKSEAVLLEKLRKAKPPLALQETPRTSIMAQLCEAAGVDFVIRQSLIESLSEEHATLTLPADATVADALNEAFPAQAGGWAVAYDAVTLGLELYTPPGYRMFETGELLKQLAAAYQKQRTVPDREQGFGGDLRTQGGVNVVVTAINKIIGGQGSLTQVEPWGSRLIVRGSVEDIALAETTLKEMGWEAPKNN